MTLAILVAVCIGAAIAVFCVVVGYGLAKSWFYRPKQSVSQKKTTP